jgi:hypothetical protein
MSEKKIKDGIDEESQVKDMKIQYGDNQISCFACGEKIDANTKICPYCKTKQTAKEPIIE